MTSSDENRNERLSQALRLLPVPETPGSVEAHVWQRVRRRRRVQRMIGASTTAIALLVGMLIWRPWGQSSAPSQNRPNEIARTNDILPEELDVLFAPPPVDELAILARRDRVSVVALNRLENGK